VRNVKLSRVRVTCCWIRVSRTTSSDSW